MSDSCEDGFYQLSRNQYNIEGARNYCSQQDRSLMPTVRTRCKVNILNEFLKTLNYPGRCEGFIGLTATHSYDKYDPNSGIFMWEDGSKDFELVKDCHASESSDCIWTDRQPDGNEWLFNVGYGPGLDDFSLHRPNRVFCEKKSINYY